MPLRASESYAAPRRSAEREASRREGSDPRALRDTQRMDQRHPVVTQAPGTKIMRNETSSAVGGRELTCVVKQKEDLTELAACDTVPVTNDLVLELHKP